jgi:hypothetical protein
LREAQKCEIQGKTGARSEWTNFLYRSASEWIGRCNDVEIPFDQAVGVVVDEAVFTSRECEGELEFKHVLGNGLTIIVKTFVCCRDGNRGIMLHSPTVF